MSIKFSILKIEWVYIVRASKWMLLIVSISYRTIIGNTDSTAIVYFLFNRLIFTISDLRALLYYRVGGKSREAIV